MGCVTSTKVGQDTIERNEVEKIPAPELFLAFRSDLRKRRTIPSKLTTQEDYVRHRDMFSQPSTTGTSSIPKLVDVTLVYKVPSSSIVLDPFDIVTRDHNVVQRQFSVFDSNSDMKNIIHGLSHQHGCATTKK
ncbi:hypothetical protein SNE40_023242 [Patella caerulea]|uniref:Uncharacterized protein n=1 Tax=Patella caerulea TaxID=87958 RepID=A0AAN8FY54_PATCE